MPRLQGAVYCNLAGTYIKKVKNLQTVDDQSNKDKEIVALEVLNIFHNPFPQSWYARRCPDIISINKQSPWPQCCLSVLYPLIGLRISQLSKWQLWQLQKIESKERKKQKIL